MVDGDGTGWSVRSATWSVREHIARDGGMVARMKRVWTCLAMLACAACGSAVRETRLANPLVTGSIAHNRIEASMHDLEEHYGLAGGTLGATATLSLLDAQRICFALTLRVEDDDEFSLDMASWQFAVSTEGHADLTHAVASEPLARHSSFYRGVAQHTTYLGDESNCTMVGHAASLTGSNGRRPVSWGVRCGNEPVYETTREQTMLRVVSGGATVCFDHGGSIDTHTDAVTLRMTEVTDPDMALAWRWRFGR